MTQSPATRVDIFCRVVDNYGDIGVAWRLARQLVAEYGAEVRLFVDDVASFEKIAGYELNSKIVDGSVFPSILHWKAPPNGEFINFCYAADIVIEAFACEIPEAYLLQMQMQIETQTQTQTVAATECKPKLPLWINLEYLSAESWVADFHLQKSPHPRLRMTKYFYFPGFVTRSGGLIREKAIRPAVVEQTADTEAGRLNVFAFGYDIPEIKSLINVIVADEGVARITLPEGGLASTLANTFATDQKINVMPFVPQPDFDSLLMAHNFLMVRGEDSFVRAQYAAKPFIWQIYPQDEAAHLLKLNAFLDLYCVGMTLPLADSLRLISNWLSGAALPATPLQYWQNLTAHLAEWRAHAVMWQHHLLKQQDLAFQLMTFYQKPHIIQPSVAPSQASFNRS